MSGMHTLRIEHQVQDYDRWKQVFDSDPADRKGSGVRAYRVMRAVDEPDLVLIDLDFDSAEEAAATALSKSRSISTRSGSSTTRITR